MRRAYTWLVLAAAPALTGCRALVESDVTYHDCDLSRRVRTFEGTTLEALSEDCWRFENAENGSDHIAVAQEDLVIKVGKPVANGRREQWFAGDQAPIAYQRIDGDFLFIARVEALLRSDASFCLPQGNMAGLVLRIGSRWLTYLIGPFPEDIAGCNHDADPGPTRGYIDSNAPWIGEALQVTGEQDGGEPLGIGVDGEADISICRVADEVSFRYRKPNEIGLDAWVDVGTTASVGGAVDVGLTTAGLDPEYAAEGHFPWAAYTEVVADGCLGGLDALLESLPPPEAQ